MTLVPGWYVWLGVRGTIACTEKLPGTDSRTPVKRVLGVVTHDLDIVEDYLLRVKKKRFNDI